MTERMDMEAWFRGFVMERSFLHRYPHYAYVLAQMTPFHDPSMEVMAVSYQRGRLFLHVNTDFFLARPHYLRGVLLHEVHHVVLGHLTRPHLRDAAHPNVMMVAMEMSANEYIDEPLPGDPITHKQFAHLGVLPGQSTRERYELLLQATRRGESLMGMSQRTVDTHHPWGVGFPSASSEEQDAPHPATQDRRPEQPVHRIIRRALAKGDDLCHELRRYDIRLAGRDSGELLQELEAVEEAPLTFVDWRAALSMFVARMRAPRRTYHRPNRRFPSQVGVVPGRVYGPGGGVKPSLLVVLDTSASVTVAELEEMARHLRLLRNLAKITVVECDARLQRVYPFAGTLQAVRGRGGTDLRPAFDPRFLREHRPDGIVYFTDGYGPYPDEPPPIPTLWVLTLNPVDHPFDCPWGEQAHFVLPPDERG